MPQDNPPLLDKTMNTTESTPRNLADVLAEGLEDIANNVKPDASDIDLSPISGMSANNVNDGFSELKQSLDKKTAFINQSAYISIKLGDTTFNGDAWLMVNVFVTASKYLRISINNQKIYEYYMQTSNGNALACIPIKNGQTVTIETNDSNITANTECAKAFTMQS